MWNACSYLPRSALCNLRSSVTLFSFTPSVMRTLTMASAASSTARRPLWEVKSCCTRQTSFLVAVLSTALLFTPSSLAYLPKPQARKPALFRSTHQQQRHVMPPSDLKKRGGGGGPQKMVARPAFDESLDDDSKQDKIANEALASIKFCYKMCFIKTAVDLAISIFDREKSVWHSNLSWFEIVDIADSMNLLYFGYGLWRLTRTYADTIYSKEKKLTMNEIFDFTKTMAGVWRK